MESLTDTPWDVTISGTGLAQSLLALALSRSGKKVLHVDKNPYYGGAEAAFSLQEAEEWVEELKKGIADDAYEPDPGRVPYEDVSIHSPQTVPDSPTKLAKSRAYTLSLSPHLIYSRSKLLPTLVSSKVYRQLEFQAVGSWWIYRSGETSALNRVPSSREDVFSDDNISLKSKRSLMKLLRHVTQPTQDENPANETEDLHLPLADYLTSRFNIPSELQYPLLSLSLCQSPPQQASAGYVVPRIKRHLASIGVFGPGFGSVLAKYGGGSEISQVGCRALAVGGGVYVLNRGIQSIEAPQDTKEDSSEDGRLLLKLTDGEEVRSAFVVGSRWDLPVAADAVSYHKVARSITVVCSPLEDLFPPTSEGGPIPAGAVVLFPGNALSQKEDVPPVYLIVHSSETGECPVGQCVIYASVSLPGAEGQELLNLAIQKLLQSMRNEAGASVLWSLRFTQLGRADDAPADLVLSLAGRVIGLPPPSLDLAFDDDMIDAVQKVWKTVMGDEAREESFMQFEDREGAGVDDE
ncbi:Rab proteins geranylgeranyltransferase component A [Paecilomyces lecythidis]